MQANTSLADAVADFTDRHIAEVLKTCGGNREKAAKLLGISQATLYRKLAGRAERALKPGEQFPRTPTPVCH